MSRIKKKQIKISLHNQTIFEINLLKFIGVIIDNNLKWYAHTGYIQNKISTSISIIYKARKSINTILKPILFFYISISYIL